ncbi:bifunctional riboflavin kinase/FAD synthetase [Pirellulaceae bacterium SH449]
MAAAWFPLIPASALGGAVAIGNFDGVHRGHLTLLSKLKQLAKQVSGPAVIVTFDPPPVKILAPDKVPPALTTIRRRVELLQAAGADHVVVLNTNAELLRLCPTDFFEQLLVNGLHAKGIVEGPNFQFGKDRQGNVDVLGALCEKQNIAFQIVEPELTGAEWVSSTRIRQNIDAGNIELANQLLSSPYRISGIVAHGAQRGRTIGFPTANLVAIPVQIPSVGVYAARLVRLVRPSGETDDGMDSPVAKAVALHIGPNPTFGEDARKVEAHIIDYSGDLYDCEVELEILSRVRGVHKFESLEALKTQLHQDINTVTTFVTQGAPIQT